MLDGLGQSYWDGQGGWSHSKPQFFTIEAFASIFRDIKVINSPKDVVQITNSDNVVFTNWIIDDLAGDPVCICTTFSVFRFKIQNYSKLGSS